MTGMILTFSIIGVAYVAVIAALVVLWFRNHSVHAFRTKILNEDYNWIRNCRRTGNLTQFQTRYDTLPPYDYMANRPWQSLTRLEGNLPSMEELNS